MGRHGRYRWVARRNLQKICGNGRFLLVSGWVTIMRWRTGDLPFTSFRGFSIVSVPPLVNKTELQSSELILISRSAKSLAAISRKHTPSGIQTGDKTAWVVFSSTETVQSTGRKREPLFVEHSVIIWSKIPSELQSMVQSTVQSPGFTNTCLTHGSYVVRTSVLFL